MGVGRGTDKVRNREKNKVRKRHEDQERDKICPPHSKGL